MLIVYLFIHSYNQKLAKYHTDIAYHHSAGKPINSQKEGYKTVCIQRIVENQIFDWLGLRRSPKRQRYKIKPLDQRTQRLKTKYYAKKRHEECEPRRPDFRPS